MLQLVLSEANRVGDTKYTIFNVALEKSPMAHNSNT